MLPERQSGPDITPGRQMSIPTDRPSLYGPCDNRWHTEAEACPLHGCAYCGDDYFQREQIEDVCQPPIGPEVDADGLSDELLASLHADHVGEYPAPSCEICEEIVARNLPDEVVHELRDCLWCEVCEAVCMESGTVCRNCRRCMDCAEVDGECGVPRWDPRLRREVWVAHHETYDPVSGRWS